MHLRSLQGLIQFTSEIIISQRPWTYSVVTVPEAVHTNVTESTSVQLVMLYNTQYNMNVTTTLCGHRNTTIHYGNHRQLLQIDPFT